MEKSSFIALIKIIRAKYALIKSHLSERSRRIWAANEAKSISRGGRQIVNTATGLAFATIQKGMIDLTQEATDQRIRKKGGGRKKKIITDLLLKQDIEAEVLSHSKTQTYLEGKRIKKIIVVPKRIVNIVY